MTLQQQHSSARPHSRRRGLTYIDVTVLILCVGLGLLIGCLSRGGSRETANRVKCASQLRSLGQAMLLYSNDNRGALPRVTYLGGPDPKPVWGTGVSGKDPFVAAEPNDVSAALFLLLRTQDITSEVFNCPSSNAVKDLYGGGSNTPVDRSNFSDVKQNLSYSLHNPYVRDGVVPADDKTYWTNAMDAGFPLAADINPGTAGGDDVLKPTATSPARDMRLGNTNNHDKDGQNILYGDGHVAWESNPFVGINRDNIYTTRDGKLAASPVDMSDSVLLPTDD
jgi:prepilin-type processing-associated H-X9-DG protein